MRVFAQVRGQTQTRVPLNLTGSRPQQAKPASAEGRFAPGAVFDFSRISIHRPSSAPVRARVGPWGVLGVLGGLVRAKPAQCRGKAPAQSPPPPNPPPPHGGARVVRRAGVPRWGGWAEGSRRRKIWRGGVRAARSPRRARPPPTATPPPPPPPPTAGPARTLHAHRPLALPHRPNPPTPNPLAPPLSLGRGERHQESDMQKKAKEGEG